MHSDNPNELELARLTNIQKASSRVLIGECHNQSRNFYHPSAMDGQVSSLNSKIYYSAFRRHGTSANYFFWDGHASSLTWGEAFQYYAPDHFL